MEQQQTDQRTIRAGGFGVRWDLATCAIILVLAASSCDRMSPTDSSSAPGGQAGTAAPSSEALSSSSSSSPSSSGSSSSAGSSGNSPNGVTAVDGVWVARPDGALGCKPESGQSLDTVAADLKTAGVTILESRKGSDHKMHVQVCGVPTGSQNAYKIPRSEFEKAKALGFRVAPGQ